jgi:hypothetical protein
MENEIKAALNALLGGIERGDAAVITREMDRLDQLVATAGQALHPQLHHFLTRRSYAKALMFLDGASDIPAGLCGGRAGQPSPGPGPTEGRGETP